MLHSSRLLSNKWANIIFSYVLIWNDVSVNWWTFSISSTTHLHSHFRKPPRQDPHHQRQVQGIPMPGTVARPTAKCSTSAACPKPWPSASFQAFMVCHYKQKNSMKDFSKCACHNEQNYLDCVLSRARCLMLLIVAIITTEILLCPIATSLIAPALSLSLFLEQGWTRTSRGS